MTFFSAPPIIVDISVVSERVNPAIISPFLVFFHLRSHVSGKRGQLCKYSKSSKVALL